MKRIFAILSVLLVSLGLVSCNKAGGDDSFVTSFYEYQTDSITEKGTFSVTDVSAINEALTGKLNKEYMNMSDAQAKAEWQSFVNSVDDSKVVFTNDKEFYMVSFVKVNVYEKGDFNTESKVVATVGKKTWKNSGAVVE